MAFPRTACGGNIECLETLSNLDTFVIIPLIIIIISSYIVYKYWKKIKSKDKMIKLNITKEVK